MDEDKRNFWRNFKLSSNFNSTIVLLGATFLVLVIVSFLLFPTAVSKKTPSKPQVLPATAANVTVDASQSLSAVGAAMSSGQLGDVFGVQLREVYFSAKSPTRSSFSTNYAAQTIARVQELAPVNGQKMNIRGNSSPLGGFDGAYGNDGDHWRQLDPAYSDWFNPAPWGPNLYEYHEFVDRVSGIPQIVVNFGSGTVQEAAKMVSYLNGTNPSDPDVQLRLAHASRTGRSQPYNTTIFEIGNENWGSWETGFSTTQPCSYANSARSTSCLGAADPAWYGKASNLAENYARRALEYARAMRAASPVTLTLYASLNDWGLGFWPNQDAIKKVVSILGDDVDGFIIHFYPQNSYWGESNSDLLGRVESPEVIIGQTESLATSLDYVRRWAAEQRAAEGKPPKNFKLSITEYNNRSSSNTQSHNLANGLFVADTIRLLAQKQIDLANYFAIRMFAGSTSGFSYFENSDPANPMPTFYATKLMTKNIGNQVINSEVSGANVVTTPGGTRRPFSYSSISSLSTLSSDRTKLYLILINKDLTYDQNVGIRLNGFYPNPNAKLTVFNGPTPDSTNATPGTVNLTETNINNAAPTFAYLLPAHSAVAFEFTGSLAAPILTPTPTPQINPTPTPTPTPEILPLITPTPTPASVMPTPTPTPHMTTPTPTPTPTPSDTTAPQVMITNPKNGATVSGKVTISAVASDNVRVTKVEFYLNNKLTFTDTSSPYSYSWNTSSYANGYYTIMVKAYDAAGNTSSANIMVNKVKKSWWKFW